MNVAELRTQLIEWLSDVKSWGNETTQNWDDYIYTPEQIQKYHMGDNAPLSSQPNVLYVLMWTNCHEYQIQAKLPDDNGTDRGYLGLTGKVRKPRTGETWQRGNDLHDGCYCKDTFDTIIKSIVRYELIAKVKSQPAVVDCCECNNP